MGIDVKRWLVTGLVGAIGVGGGYYLRGAPPTPTTSAVQPASGRQAALDRTREALRRIHAKGEGGHFEEAAQVWVNPNSGIYHRPGHRWYGRTSDGFYMSEGEAKAKGYRQSQSRN